MNVADELRAWVIDARDRTLALYVDLLDDQLRVPRLDVVNPPLWELGHVAWFQEYWVLRRALGRQPLMTQGDALFDSAAVAHDRRWQLDLPDRDGIVRFLTDVRDQVLRQLDASASDERFQYFVRLAVFHEDMHAEAMAYTRQTLALPAPATMPERASAPVDPAEHLGDARVPGGVFRLGASRDAVFVFDNEKWEHEVRVAPFAIARLAVTESEFAAFVDDAGYGRETLWTRDGWLWRASAGANQPLYWRRSGAGWERRVYDAWSPLAPHRAMVHVNAHEAEAYCRWANRRLPTEAEWEMAAACEPRGDASLATRKRIYPWGDGGPTREHAHLDGVSSVPADVRSHALGDSAFGCRQMLGNVWEWTASRFEPYPGFVRDPYAEYSEPWFHSRRVLRGGCWMTRARLLRNTWRNFFTPDRRDVFAGFRTCALDA